MRIVEITPYFPPSKGGISSFVSGLVKNLAPFLDIHVIAREGSPSEKVSVLRVSKGWFILKSIQILGKVRPEVIHCHSHWHMLSPALAYKRFHPKARVFFTFHTDPEEEMKPWKGRIYGRLLSKCDEVTFVSSSLMNRVSNYITIRTKKRVIHPGVETKEVGQNEITAFSGEHDLAGKSPILVFIGLLEWEKKVLGVMKLLEATDILRNEYPGMRLLIVGDGSKRAEVEAHIKRLNLSENVRITGLVDNVFVPLSICDLYIHISHQEGLPQSVLEAMALGKPVIASHVGGIPEVIQDGINGILVGVEREAIVSAVKRLLENKAERERLGANAKSFIQSKMTWAKVAQKFKELYLGS